MHDPNNNKRGSGTNGIAWQMRAVLLINGGDEEPKRRDEMMLRSICGCANGGRGFLVAGGGPE